jgi:hypothetical protein
MNKKFSLVYKIDHQRILLLLLIALIITLLKITPTVTYAQNLLQVVVGVEPYYKTYTKGYTLYLDTNMTLYVNSKKINYN